MSNSIEKVRELLENTNLDRDTLDAILVELELIQEHQEDLERTETEKTIINENLIHDFRTKLSGVIGFSRLLKEEIHGELNGEQMKRLDKVLLNAEDLLKSINDIYDELRK